MYAEKTILSVMPLYSPQFCLVHKHQQIHFHHHLDDNQSPSCLSQCWLIAQEPKVQSKHVSFESVTSVHITELQSCLKKQL